MELTILERKDSRVFQELQKELQDSWRKRQMFRTETEE